MWPKLYPATSKNGDKATLASPVPSPPKTMFSKESFALSQKKKFCWRLLGLIPGGTPFSQLNKGVRDVMSATTKRDVKHQVFAKTCKGPQVPTKSKHGAKNAESHEGTKKRAPVKSKGKHLCQSGKMQPKEEGFGETRRKHLCQSQKCALETRKVRGLNKL